MKDSLKIGLHASLTMLLSLWSLYSRTWSRSQFVRMPDGTRTDGKTSEALAAAGICCRAERKAGGSLLQSGGDSGERGSRRLSGSTRISQHPKSHRRNIQEMTPKGRRGLPNYLAANCDTFTRGTNGFFGTAPVGYLTLMGRFFAERKNCRRYSCVRLRK